MSFANNYLVNYNNEQLGIFYLNTVLNSRDLGVLDKKNILDAINVLLKLDTCSKCEVKEDGLGE